MGTELKQLTDCNRLELVQAWAETIGSSPPPNTSQNMMRLVIGWEIQAKTSRPDTRALKMAVNKLLRYGDGTNEIASITTSLPKPKIDLSPGTRLSRDWQGNTYVVDVLDKGYAFKGRLYGSLSPIAKTITGVHRSGPHFFGVSS